MKDKCHKFSNDEPNNQSKTKFFTKKLNSPYTSRQITTFIIPRQHGGVRSYVKTKRMSLNKALARPSVYYIKFFFYFMYKFFFFKYKSQIILLYVRAGAQNTVKLDCSYVHLTGAN